MLKPSAHQSDDQTSSVAEPSQQLWTSAACPAVDHDARPESEVLSSGRPPLPPSCVAIIAAAGGIAVANLYYNQPMLPDVGRSFGVAANVIALLPMLTQIGYALGLFLFVPLGDVVHRHRDHLFAKARQQRHKAPEVMSLRPWDWPSLAPIRTPSGRPAPAMRRARWR